MPDYQIDPTEDITTIHLKLLLEGKVPKVARLHTLFTELEFDRILQAYIDSQLEKFQFARQLTDGDAHTLNGMNMMARNLKQFISNIGVISKIAETPEATEDELATMMINGISKNDLKRALGELNE